MVSVAAADFCIEVPTHDITTNCQSAHDLPQTAADGGVWEGSGRRAGHQICWRVSGMELELSETCLLPGVAIVGGDLRLRFATPLVSPIGVAQLPGADALLLSIATHAPSGGVFVHQLRFALDADAALVPGAVVRRASWLAASPDMSLATPGPVCGSLGTVHCAAADERVEVLATGALRTSLLLAGDAAHAIYLTLVADATATAQGVQTSETELRTDRSMITKVLGSVPRATSLLSTVADTIGLPASKPANPADALAAVRLLPTGSAGACLLLTLARGGALRVWALAPHAPAAAAAHPAEPALLLSTTLATLAAAARDTPGSTAAGGMVAAAADALACTLLAATLHGDSLGLAVALGGRVYVTCCAAADPAAVAAHLSDVRSSWAPLGAPGDAGAGAPLLRLAVVAADAGGASWRVLALVGGGAPALYAATLPSGGTTAAAAAAAAAAAPSWARLVCDADAESASSAEDAAPLELPEGGALATVSDHYLSRLLMPTRFAPRHLAAAQHALLPATPLPAHASSSSALATALRAGFDARIAELDAAATAVGAPGGGASARALEQQLGDSLLSYAASCKAAPHAILALGALTPPPPLGGGASAADAAPTPLVLTSARLSLLHSPLTHPPLAHPPSAPPPPLALLLGAARAFGRGCLAAAAEHSGGWTRALLTPHPGGSGGPPAGRCALATARAFLARAAQRPPAAAPDAAPLPRDTAGMPPEWGMLLGGKGGGTGGGRALAAASQLVGQLASPPPAEMGFAPEQWHDALLRHWRELTDEPASVAPAHALGGMLSGAAATAALHAGEGCRDVLLLLEHAAQRAPACGLSAADAAKCREGTAASLPSLARLQVSCELLRHLATHTPPASPALASSALEQLLRAAPLPLPPSSPVLDTAPFARALLTFVTVDVAIAHTADPADALHLASGEWPGGMAALLCAAKLWRPLQTYLRLLASPSPLHTLLGAIAALHAKRFDVAASRFRAAVDGAPGAVVRALLRAAALPELQPFSPPAPGDEAEDWCRYQYAAAVWRAFKSFGQEDLVLAFAQPTLALPVLRRCAPHQCASVASLVFASALALGRIREAHGVVERLASHATAERADGRAEASAVFRERCSDALRSLVSTLHTRGALHVLSTLPFTPSLAEELHATLLSHARASAVAVPATAGAPRVPTAYEVGYAMHVRAAEYAAGAKCLFELAARHEGEWKAKLGVGRADELRAHVQAQADALGGCICALELVDDPYERMLLERVPNRADRLEASLAAHRALAPTERPESRGLPMTMEPTKELHYASTDFSFAEMAQRAMAAYHKSESRAADGADGADGAVGGVAGAPDGGSSEAAPAIAGSETIEGVVARVEAELRALRAKEDAEPEAFIQQAPVQIYHLRQRRGLALARAALLDAMAPSQQHALPLPHDDPVATAAYNAGLVGVGGAGGLVADSATLVEELLRCGQFDRATELAALFNAELRANVPHTGRPAGLPLVVAELAAHCVRVDHSTRASGAEAAAPPSGDHREWRRLQAILQRHDCAAWDCDLGVAAARGALSVDSSHPLPRWLLEHASPPAPGTPQADGSAAPLVLRLTARAAVGPIDANSRRAFDTPLNDQPGFERAVQKVIDEHPAAAARLVARGHVAWRGDASVIIPPHPDGSEAAAAAHGLELALRRIDPGCRPLRRNPAALCRALLECGVDGQLLEAMRLVRAGCEAALQEKARWGNDATEQRDRWVTDGLVDQVHAAVARAQGVAPWEADGTQLGVLQPELGRTFDAIERYLDIDLPAPWAPPDKARRVADACIDGEWDGEPPRALLPADHFEPRMMSTEERFLMMLETAIKR